ncbi:unnamed protein product, partial [Musa hybrid cultivar]
NRFCNGPNQRRPNQHQPTNRVGLLSASSSSQRNIDRFDAPRPLDLL